MGFKKEKRPLDVRTASRRDMRIEQVQQTVIASTAASTSLGPGGIFSVTSTSTGEVGFEYTIATDFKAGDRLSLMLDTVEGTTTTHLFRFGSATVVATSATMVVMSTIGSGVSLIAVSTSRWLTDGNQGATFSTST